MKIVDICWIDRINTMYIRSICGRTWHIDQLRN